MKLDGFDWWWSFALAFKLVAEPLVAELSCKEAELQCICTLQIALEKSIGFKLKPDIAAEQVLLRVFGDQPVLLLQGQCMSKCIFLDRLSEKCIKTDRTMRFEMHPLVSGNIVQCTFEIV